MVEGATPDRIEMPAVAVAKPTILFRATTDPSTTEKTQRRSTIMVTTIIMRALIRMTGPTTFREGIIRTMAAMTLAAIGTRDELPKRLQRRPAEIYRKNVAGQHGKSEVAGTLVLE